MIIQNNKLLIRAKCALCTNSFHLDIVQVYLQPSILPVCPRCVRKYNRELYWELNEKLNAKNRAMASNLDSYALIWSRGLKT